MKTSNLKMLAIMLGGSLIFTSCLDNQLPEVTAADFEQVNTEAFNTPESDAIVDEVETAITKFEGTLNVASQAQKVVAMVAGPKVTLISEGYPAEYIIDFGDWGYTDALGREFKGQVLMTIRDKEHSLVTYTDKEFFLNDNKVNFYREKSSVKGVLYIKSKEVIHYKDGRESAKYWEKERTLIDNGGDLNAWWNFSFSTTGFSEGTTINGVSYRKDIIKPLITEKGYRYFVKGVVQTKTEKGIQIIDFGDGEQDNIAFSTINDVTQKIELKW
jgi:hypothetical protein